MREISECKIRVAKVHEREMTLAQFMMHISFDQFVCLYTCNDAALDRRFLFKFVMEYLYQI
jgi:hypothetical protein